MGGQWWRVKPPIDSEFLVLVVNDRVAVLTRDYGLFEIGDQWEYDARRRLSVADFTCTMETP